MSTKHATTEYRGHNLHYMADDDKWMGGPDGMPGRYGSLVEVMEAIDLWEIECQKLAGTKVWVIEHSDPKYWSKGDAVFRSTSGSHFQPTHMVEMRNGGYDPNSLYARPRGDVTMDTPEALEAIEKAKSAYALLVEASENWRAAKRKIPTMTAEEWAALPEKPARLGGQA